MRTSAAPLNRRNSAMHPFDFYHEDLKTPFEDFLLDVDIPTSDGQPYVAVVGVYAPESNTNLLDSPSPSTYRVAHAIAMAAEGDESWCDRVLAKEGWYFVGRGALDPTGRWKVEAAE